MSGESGEGDGRPRGLEEYLAAANEQTERAIRALAEKMAAQWDCPECGEGDNDGPQCAECGGPPPRRAAGPP